jgi:hypothetical protein
MRICIPKPTPCALVFSSPLCYNYQNLRKGAVKMKKQFPRTQVENVSLSRMLIGTNWLLGWSHTSASADEMIKRRYESAEAFKPILETYLSHGVDSIMAPFGLSPELTRAVKETEQHMGREIVMIDTPTLDVADSAEGRRISQRMVGNQKSAGRRSALSTTPPPSSWSIRTWGR